MREKMVVTDLLRAAAGGNSAMIATLIAIFFSVVLSAPAHAANLPPERTEYLLSQMEARGVPRAVAETLLEDGRLEVFPPRVVAPREIDWDKVIAGLVSPASVRSGVEFINKYEAALDGAERQYGVDREIIAGLLRTESNFGRSTGNYVAFNVFYTLLVQREEERRWKFAADNLAALAAFCQRRGGDCFEVKGSYGGALGAAQFLPFSVIEWGVDGNGDQVVNPYEMEDAIHSAANFLVKHGWHDDATASLGKYYGQTIGYPRAVQEYAEALRKATGREKPVLAAPQSDSAVAPSEQPSSTPSND
jgi:membrane-bound lytic murein transglycosylase B